MNCSFLLRAAAVAVVVAVLAATAGAASYVSVAPIPSDLLWSTPFLWITANAIIVWLFVFSHRCHTGAAVSSSSAGYVSAAMAGLFPSSDHADFSAALDDVVAPVLVLPRQPREARKAKRPPNSPRVRKKSAGEDKRPGVIEAEAKPGVKKEHIEEAKPIAATAAVATVAEPIDTDDVSMDSAWHSIVRRGAARPIAVRKSETWGGEKLPRMQRAADKAVGTQREMRKSASMVPPSPPHPSASSSSSSPVAPKQGWRTRDVLVMAQDELLRRAESFIRRQHEHLRIQRQESDQRQAMEQDRRRLALVRV